MLIIFVNWGHVTPFETLWWRTIEIIVTRLESLHQKTHRVTDRQVAIFTLLVYFFKNKTGKWCLFFFVCVCRFWCFGSGLGATNCFMYNRPENGCERERIGGVAPPCSPLKVLVTATVDSSPLLSASRAAGNGSTLIPFNILHVLNCDLRLRHPPWESHGGVPKKKIVRGVITDLFSVTCPT